MANDATTWAMTHPSHMEPGIVLQINQKSDFIYLLGRPELGSIGRRKSCGSSNHEGNSSRLV